MKWIKIYDSLAQAKQFLKDGRIAKHFIEEEFVCVVYSKNQFFAFLKSPKILSLCEVHKFAWQVSYNKVDILVLDK